MKQITFNNYSVTTCDFFLITIHYVSVALTATVGPFRATNTRSQSVRSIRVVSSYCTACYIIQLSYM